VVSATPLSGPSDCSDGLRSCAGEPHGHGTTLISQRWFHVVDEEEEEVEEVEEVEGESGKR